MTVELTIEALGAQGDGLGQQAGNRVLVPLALPGERVRAAGEPPRLNLIEVLKPSADRVDAPCPHFAACGGCSLQHLASTPYLSWKRGLVQNHFDRVGVSIKVEPCLTTAPGSRGRVAFALRRDQDGTPRLGFSARKSHSLVEIAECTIAEPRIVTALPDLRALAARLPVSEARLLVTACENGLDLAISFATTLSGDHITALVADLATTSFLRCAINGNIVFERERPVVLFGGVPVTPPPGGFLQAVPEAEQAMARLVMDHLKGRKRLLDLFAGSGTFALRLARSARVHAVEADEPALESLLASAGSDGLKPVSTERRDLFRQPLAVTELAKFDGVCLDPPRAGAEAQIRQLAKAQISRLVYVSCNPKSLARDAAILIQVGWSLERVVPVDQFLYSHHVEAVALFKREALRTERSIFR